MTPKTIIFVGPQGSGKGTQVRRIIAHLKEVSDAPVVDLETGRGFRTMAESASYTATRVGEVLEHGEMVPNFLTSSIVMSEVAERITADAHVVIDGFPRNTDQARVLEQMMLFYKRTELIVIHLDVPDDVVMARMHSRGRDDDQPDLIKERLRLYYECTEPLVAHYQARPNTTFLTVDGTASVEEVWQQIAAIL